MSLRQLQVGLLFADNICLMAALNKLIDKCSEYCSEFGLSLNAKKSKVMLFSKNTINHDALKPVTLNGVILEYTNSVTYLGTLMVNDKGFSYSSDNSLVKWEGRYQPTLEMSIEHMAKQCAITNKFNIYKFLRLHNLQSCHTYFSHSNVWEFALPLPSPYSL